jgi:hypothetical protein
MMRTGHKEDGMKKRVAYGTDLVEWTDDEAVARRYAVVDFRQQLINWVPAALKEEKAMPAEVLAAMNRAWIKQGSIVR